jgi:signal peptidase I
MDQRRNSEAEETTAPPKGTEIEESSASGGQISEAGEGTPADGTSKNPRQSKGSGELVEWIKALAIAGVLVFIIRWFLVSPFIVDGPSMQPNFLNRERIIVNKIVYDIRQPKRGEVIVFHVPEEGRDFIKRVIGVPGDTVKVEGDKIFVNGKQIAETYLKKAYDEAHAAGKLYNARNDDRSDFPNGDFPDGKVPAGSLFVMGDNRPNSEDSRMIGFIPLNRVVGRADMVFWPLSEFHFISHP